MQSGLKKYFHHYFWMCTAGCALLAFFYLQRGFSFLMRDTRLPVDLALRWWEVQNMMDGINIFSELAYPTYPPSTLLFLYPFIGWAGREEVQLIWAIWNALALIVIMAVTWYMLKEYMPAPFATGYAVMVLAFQSIGQGLGIGQITVFYMAFFAVHLYLIQKNYVQNNWLKYGITPLLIAIYIGKFTIFLPVIFYLFLIKEHRNTVLIAAFYHLLGFVFVSFHLGIGVPELIDNWLNTGYAFEDLGSLDLSYALLLLGIDSPWSLITALILMVALSAWLKIKDFPELVSFAVLMIFARFWMYHNHYDNLMLWVVFVALLILYQKNELRIEPKKALIGISLFVLTLIIPARFLYWEAPFYGIFLLMQLIVWTSVVIVIIRYKKVLE